MQRAGGIAISTIVKTISNFISPSKITEEIIVILMAESQMEYNWVYKFDYFMICLLHESSSRDEKLNE